MPTTHFGNLDALNSFYRSIISHGELTKFNDAIYVLMKFKHFDVIRSSLAIEDIEERYRFMQNMFLNIERQSPSCLVEELPNKILLTEQAYQASDYSNSGYYIYPYSKTKFIDTFFADFIPSYRSRFLEYLVDKLCIIRQVGSGTGSAIIVRDYEFTSQTLLDDINLYCSINLQSKDILDSINSLQNVVVSQNKDIEYLNNYINILESSLLQISKELDEERKQGVNGFYRTWH